MYWSCSQSAKAYVLLQYIDRVKVLLCLYHITCEWNDTTYYIYFIDLLKSLRFIDQLFMSRSIFYQLVEQLGDLILCIYL